MYAPDESMSSGAPSARSDAWRSRTPPPRRRPAAEQESAQLGRCGSPRHSRSSPSADTRSSASSAEAWSAAAAALAKRTGSARRPAAVKTWSEPSAPAAAAQRGLAARRGPGLARGERPEGGELRAALAAALAPALQRAEL